MNLSKNLYVFMLGTLIVFSGCFGTGTTDGQDADDGEATTVINNYYNNTTTIVPENNYYWNNTTIIVPEPEVFAANGEGGKWVTIITINQSTGEAIHILDATAAYTVGINGTVIYEIGSMTILTNCTNGMQWSESIHIANEGDDSDAWLTGAGLECTHELQPVGQDNAAWNNDERLSVVFERRAVTVV